ncbi:MAG: hypothetical protein ACXWL9_10895 [Syntrophales bacterium]
MRGLRLAWDEDGETDKIVSIYNPPQDMPVYVMGHPFATIVLDRRNDLRTVQFDRPFSYRYYG